MRVSSVVFSLAALAGLTAAQSIPACATSCIDTAAKAAGCTSGTDLGCICTSEGFQSAAARCISSACTPDQVQQVTQAQQQACSGFTLSGANPSATGAPSEPAGSGSSSGSPVSSAVSSTPPTASVPTSAPSISASGSAPGTTPIPITGPNVSVPAPSTPAPSPSTSAPPNAGFKSTGSPINLILAVMVPAAVLFGAI